VSKPPQTVVPLQVTARVDLGATEANAMSVGAGAVWLATQSITPGASGALVRIDASTSRQTARLTVGGDPVAVAADGAFVWVANGDGDGSHDVPAENTVEQFDATTGALVHRYRLLDPRGLVANATSALVISETPGQQTPISLLTAGTATPVVTLPGTLNAPVSSLSPEVAVAACSDQVFVALTDLSPSASSVTIYAMRPDGGGVRKVATIPNDYEASMTCDTASVFLIGAAGDGDVTVASVSIADGDLTNLWEGPYPVSLAFLAGRVWINYADDALNLSLLTSLDPVTGLAAPTRSVLPPPPSNGDPSLLVPGDSGLWIVASQGNQLLHVAAG
jgi:hypothetical protein